MADEAKIDGKGSYGTVHVMEEEMRAAEQGVFEKRSGEAKRSRAKAAATPATKAEGAAPENKSAKSK